MRLSKEQAILDRLRGKPHLRPVFQSVYDIPRRLEEYDENLFVVWNTVAKRYEVHSLANVGDTFCIAADGLDERLLRRVYRYDLRVHGRRIFREIEDHNERLRRSKERARKNEREAIALEMKPYFARFAWEEL